jgi:hypothetical protein
MESLTERKNGIIRRRRNRGRRTEADYLPKGVVRERKIWDREKLR